MGCAGCPGCSEPDLADRCHWHASVARVCVTTQEIRADGFEPDETFEMLLSGDTPTAICKSMGQALIDYDEALQRLNPDMVVLGDRFETFWSDYMFEISEGKFSDLRSKFPTAKFAKTRALPKPFTEKGATRCLQWVSI